MQGFFVDVETGGLSPERDALLSIGAVRFDLTKPEVVTDAFSVHVAPSPRVSVCLEALRVQGLNWRKFAAWTTPDDDDDILAEADAFNALTTFFGKHTSPDCPPSVWHRQTWAHNADFDYRFVAALADRVPGTAGMFPRRPRWNCTKNLYGVCVAAGLLADTGSVSLDSLCQAFGVDRPQAHDALLDATAGAKCLAGMWRLLRGGTA